MNCHKLNKIILGLFLSSISLFAIDANNGKEIIDSKCVACHSGSTKNGLSRISDQRKTPEGWNMTITRMQRLHGLSLSADEEQDVIKYLSDNQGLTPKEIEPFTYILDKTPNTVEKQTDTLFTEMCVRCHSHARAGLQRRTAKEWDRLVNFHVGQFTSFEFQSGARDRDWFGIAQNEVVPYLEKTYGKNEKIWQNYKNSSKDYKLPLKWTFYGHNSKDGDFSAKLTLQKAKDDSYLAKYEESYLDGKTFVSRGRAILYSGSELRVSLQDSNKKRFQQVLHIDPKNSTIKGRIYETLHHELGSSLNGVANKLNKTYIAGIYPSALKANKKTKLVIVGSNLSNNIILPSDIKILKTLSSSKTKIELEVLTKDITTAKQYDITVNNKKLKNTIAIYNKIDFIKVTPSFAIARFGAENEKIKKEFAQFEAIGYSLGKDGKQNTQDDIKLGSLPVLWNMSPHDEQAEEDRDIMYAGTINRYSGLFTPSEGGPNPTRKLMANNVGNLTISATYMDGEKKLEAKSHLIVTVPKFVNPPIN